MIAAPGPLLLCPAADKEASWRGTGGPQAGPPPLSARVASSGPWPLRAPSCLVATAPSPTLHWGGHAQGTPSSASASLSVHSSEAGCSPRHFSVGGTSASNSGNASSSHSWAISHAEKPQVGHNSWAVWAVWRETWSSHRGVPPARRLLLRSPDSPPSRHY